MVARPAGADSAAAVPGAEAAGTFAPAGPPAPAPVRIDAGGGCIVELSQEYAVSGTLSGTAQIDYRILVAGPCGSPPGTFDEQWIAYGTFAGTVDGTAATGKLTYTARVRAGGAVDGRMAFGQGMRGELRIQGSFSAGALSYQGRVARE